MSQPVIVVSDYDGDQAAEALMIGCSGTNEQAGQALIEYCSRLDKRTSDTLLEYCWGMDAEAIKRFMTYYWGLNEQEAEALKADCLKEEICVPKFLRQNLKSYLYCIDGLGLNMESLLATHLVDGYQYYTVLDTQVYKNTQYVVNISSKQMSIYDVQSGMFLGPFYPTWPMQITGA